MGGSRPQSAARRRRDTQVLPHEESPRPPTITEVTPNVSTVASFTPGERIKCQLPEWNSSFKGLVNRVNGDGTFCIHFDDGEIREEVEERYLEKILNYFSNL